MPGMQTIDVVEFTDPGCSWAWGTEPKLRALRWRFGDRVRWRRVMGALVGDMENLVDGAYDPVRLAQRYGGYWEQVGGYTGMPYPAKLPRMYRSTEPACRAVQAAGLQSEEIAQRVLRRLREAIFVFGEPPDTLEHILAAVRGVPDLDVQRLERDYGSDVAEKVFKEDWDETRRPNEYVMNLEGDRPGIGRAKHTEGHWRYVFPTVIFRAGDAESTVPGWCDYDEYTQAMEQVAPGSLEDPRPNPTPQQVFETWPTATAKELEVLCGAGAEPPGDVVAHDLGGGTLYMTPAEAQGRLG
jgi:predicted DsbA family dithiol-disulfide isomerase